MRSRRSRSCCWPGWDIELGTTPDESWGGFTGDWSDHDAFVRDGVPIAYFEAWDWSEGDLWEGQETPEGDYLHTPDDVYETCTRISCRRRSR